MNFIKPWPLLTFRGLVGLAMLGLIMHLVKGAMFFTVTYKAAGWIIVGVLVFMLLLSWVKRPLSAYVIAIFVPLLPATFLASLWFIVLPNGSVWESILIGGSFMSFPITMSIQIIRDRATRRYFNMV